ncbi:hypothetical protein C8J56DRAFT_836816 [Mycena floridula]|nr:hypothetical protein C8J56DRAFT_836816 [Mycena floridula]
MENPWANAWGDPADQQQSNSEPKWHSKEDTEVDSDIAVPSWSTGAAIPWSEPSESQSSFWTPPSVDVEAADEWKPQVVSPYESIQISRSEQESAPSSRSTTPEAAPHSLENSPDAFGTFESATDEPEDLELDPWSPSRATFAPPSAGSNTWGQEPDSANTDQSVDEWEAAKEQKLKQDRYVPPELLASILRQFEELSDELWPNAGTSSGDEPPRRRLEDLDEMKPIVNKLVPSDLMLQPLVPFSKTFMSKSMNEAIRLTRHVPFTHSSPMAQYVASKGSTAWEASVKSRQEQAQDDLLPPGWRLMEKQKDEGVAPELKRKTTGGLLSFFGRRPTSPPVSERSSSPASRKVVSTANTPRGSFDSARPVETPPPMVSSFSEPLPAKTDNTSFTSILATIPDIPREPTPPPSVVSRFLGRFSRGRPQERTFALSSNDLEFLSDIVPSASDGIDLLDAELISPPGVNLFDPAPLPPKLPPPTSRPVNGDDPFSLFELPSTNGAKHPTATRSNSGGPKRSFMPIMASSSSSPAPSVPPKLDSGFNFPAPPRSQTPVRSTFLADLTKPIPPPPVAQSASAAFFDDNDDEFSAFHSEPATAKSSVTSEVYDSSISSISSDHGLYSGESNTSNPPESFDDFDDFVFSPLQSPPAPIPPLKQPAQQPAPHKAAEPERTVLANHGGWPTTASPLPPPLAPPPSNDFDIFGAQKMVTSNASSGLSQEHMLHRQSTLSLAPIMFQSQKTISPQISGTSASSSGSTTKSGGLSAQDLSFFEGL